jgi:DNA-binding CsgD family transcriptional regulator
MSALLLRPVALSCRDFLLESGAWIIGRSKECDLVVDDRTVSRRHAKVVVANGRARITDLGSRNGTWLEGKRIRKSAAMVAGQAVRLGDIIFAVLPWNPPERRTRQSEDETGSCDSEQREGGAAKLSAGQHRILVELLKGSSEKEIGTKLHLSQHTVHNHVSAIHHCFDVHSRSELLVLLIPTAGDTPVADDPDR